jgi:hypothetical protein
MQSIIIPPRKRKLEVLPFAVPVPPAEPDFTDRLLIAAILPV